LRHQRRHGPRRIRSDLAQGPQDDAVLHRVEVRIDECAVERGHAARAARDHSVDWNAWARGDLGGNPAAFLNVPGTEVTCQWWGRDTAANGIYLTEALVDTVCP
jgi:hypothetical protein